MSETKFVIVKSWLEYNLQIWFWWVYRISEQICFRTISRNCSETCSETDYTKKWIFGRQNSLSGPRYVQDGLRNRTWEKNHRQRNLENSWRPHTKIFWNCSETYLGGPGGWARIEISWFHCSPFEYHTRAECLQIMNRNGPLVMILEQIEDSKIIDFEPPEPHPI